MKHAPITTILVSAVVMALVVKLVVSIIGNAEMVVYATLLIYPLSMMYLFWRWGILK
jgi:hypothetical protein